MPHRRLLTRAGAVVAQGAHEAHLDALAKLVERSFTDPSGFFEHGLALLVQQLQVECAMILRLADLGPEPMWWVCSDGPWLQELLRGEHAAFCQAVLRRPHRSLVIQDLATSRPPGTEGSNLNAGVRGALGSALWHDGKPGGVLLLLDRKPHSWIRGELALVAAMSNLFARTMEVEALKYELRVTRDALDLASAIVEDSAFESAGTGLPSGHYLEIWLRANLFLARRRDEVMAVVGWHHPVHGAMVKKLKHVAEGLRGEDLMVDLGHGDFMLLLPRTDQQGAVKPLERLRDALGPIPMGATLWLPTRAEDREDLTFQVTRGRIIQALARAKAEAVDGFGQIHWFLEMPDGAAPPEAVIQPI